MKRKTCTKQVLVVLYGLETMVLKKRQEGNILDVLVGRDYAFFIQFNMVP